MAVKTFAACLLLLYISGTCSSAQNKANDETGKLKNEGSSVFHQEEPKKGTKALMFEELFGIILPDNEGNNEATTEKEKTENTAIQKEMRKTTTVEEMKSKHTSDKTTEMLSTSSQSPSTSEVRQHSMEATAETSGSSVTSVLNQATPSVNGKTLETASTSQSDSSVSEPVLSTTNSPVSSTTNSPVSSTTNSPVSSTHETYSSVTQTASSESLMGVVTTESNISFTKIVAKAVSEAPEHVNKNSSKGKRNLVTALLCVLTGLTVFIALLVYKKSRERSKNVPLEHLKLLP